MKINGMPVVNATKPLNLTITKSDVTLGANKDPAACAAARSACRLPQVDEARIHLGRAYIRVGKKWTRYETGRSLRTEIIAFDRGGTFEPGEYQLGAVRESHRFGRQQGSKTSQTKPKGVKKKARAKPHVVSNVRHNGANR